jgi:hypothetical protein
VTAFVHAGANRGDDDPPPAVGPAILHA